jgi:uncharacterized membrane protein
MTPKRFFLFVVLITFAGTLLRLINMNYASLWADELYSMLAVRPGNSWYEILYMQRAYQPPGYFILLWVWTKLFAFNEFYARLLSIIGGAMAITISAYLGRTVKGNKLGLVMALIVAFNPTQIWYSLEARFYVFVYFLAALSLLLYWNLRKEKPHSLFLYGFKGGVDAALCYFHHFGIVFVFAQGLFDLLLLKKDKDKVTFFKMLLGYFTAAVLYIPWVFWGLTEGLGVKQYWLKETNVLQFLRFNFGYTSFLTIGALLLAGWFIVTTLRQRNWFYLLFPFIISFVILVPVLYSLIKMPILVDRYAMVLGPILYLMMGMSILQIGEKIAGWRPRLYPSLALAIIILAFSLSGIYMSLIDKSSLVKQPWREMAAWINRQPDSQQVPVYALGAMVKGQFNIDFYLKKGTQAKQLSTLVPGKDDKMYLVETSGTWSISDSVKRRIDSIYTRKCVAFKEKYPGFGNIYICERKQPASIAFHDSVTLKSAIWTAR